LIVAAVDPVLPSTARMFCVAIFVIQTARMSMAVGNVFAEETLVLYA
jgi:hypothetical protein